MHIRRTLSASGTGASAIYPLLACKLEPTWSFVATGRIVTLHQVMLMIMPDVDQKSLSMAEQNVAANNLQERIEIVQSTSDGPVLSPLMRDADARQVLFL